MKKNVLKIILDIIMTGLLVLLYNSHVISITFHEIGGLIIFGLFIVHCIFNRKWIIAITKKIFTKSLSVKVRIGYLVDFLLLLSFLFIIFSGICISKVLFPSAIQISGIQWKSVHVFFSALSLILVGIHLGLHWNFITGMFKKLIKLPKKIALPVNMVLIVTICFFGAYNIKVSGFTGWLTQSANIFQSSSSANYENRGGEGGRPSFGEKQGSTDNAEENTTENTTENNNVENNGESMKGHSVDGNLANNGSFLNILSVVARYLSIVALFCIVTYYLNKILMKIKTKKTMLAK